MPSGSRWFVCACVQMTWCCSAGTKISFSNRGLALVGRATTHNGHQNCDDACGGTDTACQKLLHLIDAAYLFHRMTFHANYYARQMKQLSLLGRKIVEHFMNITIRKNKTLIRKHLIYNTSYSFN